jgi:hypothetical protein
MNIQAQYDLELAEQEVGNEIARTVKPVSNHTDAAPVERTKRLPAPPRRRASA